MATAEPRGERRREAARQLDAAIDALEGVRWSDVPGVSSVTAATFCRTLRWSREAIAGEADVRDEPAH